MENVKKWYNYKTGEHDYRETPTDFSDYISQDSAGQAMYRFGQDMGNSPAGAAMKVLSAQIEGRKTEK